MSSAKHTPDPTAQMASIAWDHFFAHAPDLMCTLDAAGAFTRVSAAFAALGYGPEDLLTRPFVELAHADDRAATAAALDARATPDAPRSFEARFRGRDGAYRWLAWNVVLEPSGAVCALGRDVSAYKSHEAALNKSVEEARQANQFLDAIIENIPDMVFLKDAETLSFARFNRAGEQLLGVPRAGLIGKSDRDFFPADEVAAFQRKDRETLRGKTLVDIPEEPIETKRGRRWLHTKKVPLLDEAGTPTFLLGISEDITERKLMTEMHERMAWIVESSNDAIISTTLDDVVMSWNRGAELIFGYTADEMVGRPVTGILPPNEPGQKHKIDRPHLERVRRGEHVDHFDAVRRRKDGSEVVVSATVSPVRDSSGAIVGMSTISRDVTEIKKMRRALELEKTMALAANRELEAFSYSVAHDLRAPLRSIDGFSQVLLDDYHDKLDAEGRKYLGFVRAAAQRMGQLIDDLLTLSRVTRSELRRETVDLSAVAHAVVDRLRGVSPARQVDVVIPDGLRANGDPRLIAVVVENLLGNAWKFTSKRPAARIELGVRPGETPAVYFVRDDGAGFDPTYGGKLFGAFQRLHSATEFEGTGIGLATVQRIVMRHGGRVWADGQVGAGATFSFTLSGEERTS